MSKKFSVSSSIVLVIAAALLIVSIFFPWWGMKFVAPQYPEGLEVVVYPYKMEGQADIINGLNHYIGMKQFSEETFPELKVMPYLIGGMAAFTLLVAFLRKKSLLYVLIGAFVVGGALGLYDIHRWLYDFGTNLDPHAPIKIKPFVPPVIGTNRIANFVTHSYFAKGSFLLGIAFLLMLVPLWGEREK